MCNNTVLLSNGQVDQLIVSVGLNKVQAFFELGSEATTKTITFLGVSICIEGGEVRRSGFDGGLSSPAFGVERRRVLGRGS